jgi:hypothetical protein
MIITKTESDKVVFSPPPLTVITFDEIFKLVVIHTINTVYSIYGDMEIIKELGPDVKKILVYSVLDQIYIRMKRETDSNSILLVDKCFGNRPSEIWTYVDKDKLESFILKTCSSISRNAPIPILVEDGCIDLTNDCGETRDILNKIELTLTKFRSKTTSLAKLKKYSKNNGLVQFMDKYYPEDNIKNSMFYNKYLKGAGNEQI